MRQLREVTDADAAQLLHDALIENGIEVQVMETQRGTHALWVLDETQLKQAQELAEAWLDRGERARLEESAKRGRAARELNERVEERRERQQRVMAERLTQLSRPRPTPLTWGLIALCVGVALLTNLGDKRDMVAMLTIVDPKQLVEVQPVRLFGVTFTWLALPWREAWRLVTPVLVHFDFLHIFFNMLWLKDLGRVVESNHGARYLGTFTLASAAISNIAQFEIGQSPMFAGMSGVVYGLLGLVWLRGKLDPQLGYGLSRGTLQFMLIWLVFGFVGRFGMANWCHLFGLAVGLGWAYVQYALQRARR